MGKHIHGAALGLLLAATPALGRVALYPVPTGAETGRFLNGTPTVSLETVSGGVELTPLPLNHGHVSFGIAVYNSSGAPVNFGIENVSATVEGAPVAILSERELERRAKSRALWTQVGMTMLFGVAAGVSSTAHTTDHAHGRIRTPTGSYTWSTAYRDNGVGALGSGLALAGGGAAIAGVQGRLDYTLANLGQTIVQTTTVEHEASYGGRVVLERGAEGRLPYDVRLVVRWNGADYPFVFRVAEEGRDTPPAYPLPAARPALAVIPPAAPAPLTMAALVRPTLPGPAPALAPAAAPAARPAIVEVAARPAAPAPRRNEGYRNGRDDAVIVPLG